LVKANEFVNYEEEKKLLVRAFSKDAAEIELTSSHNRLLKEFDDLVGLLSAGFRKQAMAVTEIDASYVLNKAGMWILTSIKRVKM
jgi:hypothetical protein